MRYLFSQPASKNFSNPGVLKTNRDGALLAERPGRGSPAKATGTVTAKKNGQCTRQFAIVAVLQPGFRFVQLPEDRYIAVNVINRNGGHCKVWVSKECRKKRYSFFMIFNIQLSKNIVL